MALTQESGIRRFVAGVMATAALFLPGAVFGATVYVQFDGSNLVQDPAFASASGQGYAAYADLQAGTFGALSSSPVGGPSENAYAGILDPLILTNIGVNSLVLPAGAAVLRIDGVYALGSQPGSFQRASTSGVFSLSTTRTPVAVARADHLVIRNVLSDGTIQAEINDFGIIFESNGAQVIPLVTEIDELQYDLAMPALVLGPGESLSLSTLLTTAVSTTNGGQATADFLNTAVLEIDLPTGFDPADLQSNAAVPLDFIVAPEPAFEVALSACVLALMFGGRSRGPRVPRPSPRSS